MSSTAQAASPFKSKSSQKNAGNTVNVLTIVDTDAIKAVYKKNPNPDMNHPTGLNNHEGITMLCPKKNFIGEIGNDPANIEFSANVGDWVSFRAITVSGNSEDAVILYDVLPYNGTPNVFNPFSATQVTLTGAVEPDTSNQHGLPPIVGSETFYSYDGKVSKKGTEQLAMRFALYELDATGENQVIYDYFWWDPSVVVQ